MRESETKTGLIKAMVKVQKSLKVEELERAEVIYVTADGRDVKFKFIDSEVILEELRRVASSAGITFSQGVDGLYLITTVSHESGEFVEYRLPLPLPMKAADFLKWKRLQICSAFGLDGEGSMEALGYEQLLTEPAVPVVPPKDSGKGKGAQGEPPPAPQKMTAAETAEVMDDRITGYILRLPDKEIDNWAKKQKKANTLEEKKELGIQLKAVVEFYENALALEAAAAAAAEEKGE